jgi:outer membrane receptor for ferrienterochelin and colicin
MRVARCISAALALIVACCAIAPADPTGLVIAGSVVDAATGLPLRGATVTVVGTSVTTFTDDSGRFSIANIPPGTYRLKAMHQEYQPALSGNVRVQAGQMLHVTLSLERADANLHVIAETSVKATSSLARASTFYRTVPTEALQRNGNDRAADALRQLPGIVNGITGDTGNPADDVQLNIRGIGTLETQATLDGHPLAFGMPSGYNYELSPLFGLRNLNVTYGSGGTSFTGVDAIGGIVDFQTIDPTPQDEWELQQGYGTFQNYATSVRATGTAGRIGYAAAYGVDHVNGALRNDSLYQPGAAYDQSASDPAVHNLGVYRTDTAAVWRSGLAKLSYALDAYRKLTLTTYASSAWSDKTGNGDGDYLDYGPALAFGQHLLSAKPSSDSCPAGTFTATNANGTPNGAGPGGVPDGGMRCQTPQQYAAFNTGYQGAGPAWQSFNLFDEHLGYAIDSERSAFRADVFTSRYAQTFDRTFQLPFKSTPGDRANWRNRQVVETGISVSHDFLLSKHDVGVGFYWLNNAYNFTQKAAPVPIPFTHESGYMLRDVYHPAPRLNVYATLWAKRASATDSSYVDPRLSIVYAAGSNDVVRFAIGKTTTQPSADMLGKAFVESPPGNAGGGASLTCSGINSIGSAPSSLLKPEKGVDEELAYAHRFAQDTQIQLSLFNVNVYDKLYSTLVPLSSVGTGFIDPAYLSLVEGIVASKCGTTNAASLLGVTGTLNIGHLQSRGFTLGGRVRLNNRLYVDYDWALTSTMLLDAPQTFLQNNLTYVLGSQLPRFPLHTLAASVAQSAGTAEIRYTFHAVSPNNTKALPAYNYSDISVSAPFGSGIAAVTVSNLFNQFADNRGLRYQGVPLALNQYATAADYAQVTGASSTERFGLPFRTIFLSYTWRLNTP